MNLTPYHAKYIAHELTRRCASDSVEKLTAVLSDAQVDLNPHQIEAALFAFRNPLSRGAILADEVGLGKTIEAGLLIAQSPAEGKRRILVIVPVNLRKQWSQELADKFFLPSVILEARTFNDAIRAGNLNPFQQNAVMICSYHFVRKMEPYIRQTRWDLVVIDEAHRLRNVYKPTNKIAHAIKQCVAPFRKVLLTATPLQNSLLELYGLVSIIDDFAFGDLKTYRSRFTRLGNDDDFKELKERLRPICKRTLRKQVLEYVKYTNRHALVRNLCPRPRSSGCTTWFPSTSSSRRSTPCRPAGQRSLMTLILRKLLASSTYAISDTLTGLAYKLETAAAQAEKVDAPPEQLAEDWEAIDELADEWEPDDGANGERERPQYTPEQVAEMRREMAKLREFHALARSIAKNSKGEVLLTALRRGFAAAAEAKQGHAGATLQQKALVFTESRRTQEYPMCWRGPIDDSTRSQLVRADPRLDAQSPFVHGLVRSGNLDVAVAVQGQRLTRPALSEPDFAHDAPRPPALLVRDRQSVQILEPVFGQPIPGPLGLHPSERRKWQSKLPYQQCDRLDHTSTILATSPSPRGAFPISPAPCAAARLTPQVVCYARNLASRCQRRICWS